MNSKYLLLIPAFLAAAAAVPTDARADFDARPFVQNNQIFTGGHDDENGIDTALQRVFGYAFGDVAADPYNIGDPGFNTAGQSSFTPGSELDYHGLPLAAGVTMRYWDGSGSPQFGPVPAGVSVGLAASPTRAILYTSSSITYTPANSTSLTIGNFSNTNGALHVHLGSSIYENGAQSMGSVPAGAYLVSYQLINPGTGVISSQPLFNVYGNDISDAQLDEGVDYVNATYVPEPLTLGGFGLVLMALRRSRRGVTASRQR